jgi:hypothetical protein
MSLVIIAEKRIEGRELRTIRAQVDDALDSLNKAWRVLDFTLSDIGAAKDVIKYTRPHTLSKEGDFHDMKFTYYYQVPP